MKGVMDKHSEEHKKKNAVFLVTEYTNQSK